MKNFSNFTEAYRELLQDVYTNPDFESAPRGQKIREKLGFTFKLTNPRNRLPYLLGRDYSAAYFIAESLWYLSGSDSTDWIANYSGFWRNISDDGVTANSAYGARIFKSHPRIAQGIKPQWSQWDYVIDELCSDNDSRRAVIHIRSPQDSILAHKDVPCTLTLQFFLRNDKVHMVTSMRSSDLILGIAYDVPAFTLFQELLALQLSKRLNKPIGLGDYTHISNSLHIYERHFEMVEQILNSHLSSNILEMPDLPSDAVPLGSLLSLESKIRKAPVEDLKTILSASTELGQYWGDWLILLASHRAGKLNSSKEQNLLLQSTNFEGYRFFNK